MKQYKEIDLVNGCIRNERIWQERLYKLYFQKMYNVCCLYSIDDQEAMDMLNQGFLRVFQKINQFSFQGSLEGWIKRVITHKILDLLKQKQKFKTTEIHAELNLSADQHSPLQHNDTNYFMSLLPPSSAKVFRLFFEEGYTHEEIAELLNISSGTSKWHVANAKQLLRKLIEKENESIKDRIA